MENYSETYRGYTITIENGGWVARGKTTVYSFDYRELVSKIDRDISFRRAWLVS